MRILARTTIAAGAIALAAGLAGTANAAMPSLGQPEIGGSFDVAPVAHKHCFPLYGFRRIHFSATSRILLVKKIIGWRCLPLLVVKPRLPIPDPGPYRPIERITPRAGL